jgi:hypothetical protein
MYMLSTSTYYYFLIKQFFSCQNQIIEQLPKQLIIVKVVFEVG